MNIELKEEYSNYLYNKVGDITKENHHYMVDVFENWVNDLKSSTSNIHAYYAISSFIVLKSNNEINAALVAE